jgi:hydrogenase maturation protease
MSLPPPVRVVGIGSPAGDDALGWEAVARLEGLLRPARGVELYRADSGQRLLDLLDGCGSLLLIDAVRGGGPAGALFRCVWPDARLARLRPGSTHDLGVVAALELAATLGLLPAPVVVFGMEAAEVGPAAGLSPPVAAALPALVRQVADELGVESPTAVNA